MTVAELIEELKKMPQDAEVSPDAKEEIWIPGPWPAISEVYELDGRVLLDWGTK